MSTTESTLSETEFATLRRHGSALVLPVLLLGLFAALFFFLDPRLPEAWQHQALLGFVLVAVLFLWLIPSVRYFTNRYVISSNRIVVYRGLTSKVSDQVSWSEISGVSVSKSFLSLSGDVQIHREFGQDLVLKRVSKAKKLVKKIERYLVSRSKKTTERMNRG